MSHPDNEFDAGLTVDRYARATICMRLISQGSAHNHLRCFHRENVGFDYLSIRTLHCKIDTSDLTLTIDIVRHFLIQNFDNLRSWWTGVILLAFTRWIDTGLRNPRKCPLKRFPHHVQRDFLLFLQPLAFTHWLLAFTDFWHCMCHQDEGEAGNATAICTPFKTRRSF
jgi:hypothetical protein